MFLISSVATRWSNSITNGSAEPPDLCDGTFHPSSGSLRGCRQPWWDAAMAQGQYVAHGGQEQPLTASWPMSQVGRRERWLFLGATQRGLIAGSRSSDMLSARHGNPNQAHFTSKSFSRTIPRLHTFSVVASDAQPPAVSFWLAFEASSPEQS